MGSQVIKMDPAQGFTAQGAGAAAILSSSHFGFPLSTTQVISGAVVGAGSGRRLSAVRWGLASNTVLAWVLTLPAAGAMGAITYGFTRIFGTGAAGPIVVLFLAGTAALLLFLRRTRSPAGAAGALGT
jgi:PiT family inorganic phosphate transporter